MGFNSGFKGLNYFIIQNKILGDQVNLYATMTLWITKAVLNGVQLMQGSGVIYN